MENEESNIVLSTEHLPGFFLGKICDKGEEISITLSQSEAFDLISILVNSMYIVNRNTSNSKKLLQKILKQHTGANFNIRTAYEDNVKRKNDEIEIKNNKNDNSFYMKLKRTFKFRRKS